MTLSQKQFLLAILVAVGFIFAVAPLAIAEEENDEVDSYEDCVEAGGVVSIALVQSFPPRRVSRCTFEGDTFTRERVMHADESGDDRDNDTDDNDDDADEDADDVDDEDTDESNLNRDQILKRMRFASSTASTTAHELFEERREELRARMLERMNERLQNILDRIHDRLEEAIERLERSALRIDEHIERFEESHDIDLVDAKEHLENGIELTEDASFALASTTAYLTDLIEDADDLSTFRSHIEDLKAMYREVRRLIKEAHAELVNAIEDIRAAFGEEENDAGEGGSENN